MITLPVGILTRVRSQIATAFPKRSRHWFRGKKPGLARSLEKRLKDDNPVDAELIKQVNIGFPQIKEARSMQLKERLMHVKAQRSSSELEKKARNMKLQINLDEERAESLRSTRPLQLVKLVNHFAIYKDLFGAAFFVPRVALDIQFECSDVKTLPVYYGNIISPTDASKAPKVKFDTSSDIITGRKTNQETYWTLALTNPDGHFSGKEHEYIHWLISNVPNDNVEKGDAIVPYIQPFPPKGLGYQRFIFVLYKQSKKLDLSGYKVEEVNNLERRTFSTYDFYRKYQDNITPAGLAFFQSSWDVNLTEFYQKVLEIKEPSFEYDFPKPFLRDPEWFPLRQPFNVYMDKHRDPKEVNKDYLKKVLSKTHPFKGPERPLKYPNAHPIKDVPSWLKTEMRNNRLKIGRINDYL